MAQQQNTSPISEMIRARFDNWTYPSGSPIEMVDDVTAAERAGKTMSIAEWKIFSRACHESGNVSDMTMRRAAASLGIILEAGQIDYEICVCLRSVDKLIIDRINKMMFHGLGVPGMLNDIIDFHRMNYGNVNDDEAFSSAICSKYGGMSIVRNSTNMSDIDGFCYTSFIKFDQIMVLRELGIYPHIRVFWDFSDKWGPSHVMFEQSEYQSIVHPTIVESDKVIKLSRTFRCENEDCTGSTIDMRPMWWSRDLLPTCPLCWSDSSEFEITDTIFKTKRIGASFKPVSIDDYLTTVDERQEVRPLSTIDRKQQMKSYTPDAVDRLSEALKGRERSHHERMLDDIEEEVRTMNPVEFEVRSFSGNYSNPFNDSKQVSNFTKDDDQMTVIRNEMAELKQFVRSISLVNGGSTVMPNDSVSKLNDPVNIIESPGQLSRVNSGGFIRSVEAHKAGHFEDKVIQGYMLTEEEAAKAERKMSELQAVCGLPTVFTDRRLDFLWYIHVPLEKYFTDRHDSSKKYPSRTPRNCFQTMLKARDSTPQTTLLRQVAKVSFDFDDGVVLSNAFDLPNMHPGQSITDLSLFIMLDQLKREYELKWHSILNGGSLPDFADRFSSRSNSLDSRSTRNDRPRRQSSSSSGSRSFVDSVVSYTSGKGGKSFTR